MKKIITLFAACIIGSNLFAQSPEKMSYQAIVRNAGSNLVTNQAVGMRISILQGSASGTAVYVETQTPTSNANGLVSIEIGAGTVVTGTFSSINWSSGPYFIQTETDPAGGTNYTITGTSQLLSVPYALYAKTAGSATIANGSISNAQVASNANIALTKLSTTGSASSSTFLRGDGQWTVPPAGNGTPAMITNSGASPISVDFSASTSTKVFVVNRGGTAGAFTCSLTLPASSNYSNGDIITVLIAANGGGAMTPSVQISGVTTLYSYASTVAVNPSSSAVALTGTAVSVIRFVKLDATTWARLQ